MEKPIFKIIVKIYNSKEVSKDVISDIPTELFAADFIVHLDSKPQEDGSYHYEHCSGFSRYTLNKIPQEEQPITSTAQAFDKYVRPTSFVQAILKRKEILTGDILELDTPVSRLLIYLTNEPLF